ncbi:uncharacterized protein A4U43_C04F31540 [Asparagus officinalis]|uniref:Cytochrome P450 n=1 Tax=Asparagus officinalis TaxID=4686 RepID=A0A5P1F5I5_ASPOF|nr:cytochrome P450 71A1-like [Asparagus officinalis]ONK73442.1 uncharacterized protein A4U43_C04F31540 [Asparagus officinalis]
MSIFVALLLLLPVLIPILKRVSSSIKHKLPPCPPKLPLIGNLHQLTSLPHHSLHALSKKHGPLMLLKLGQVPTLVVSSPDMTREILRTHDHIFGNRPSSLASTIMMYGARDVVFAPYSQHWRQTKKLCVNHLLSTKMVQSFRSVLEEEVTSMVSSISDMCTSRATINMSEVLHVFVNRLVCRIISGRYFTDEGRCRVMCKMIDELSVTFGQISIGDFMPWLGWLDRVSGLEARTIKSFKKWDSVLDEIIEENTNSLKGKMDAGEKLDFVDVLLALQSNKDAEILLNRDTIKAILLDMIAAGTDTTFLVLDWGMTELARHPEVMKKVQNEVREILSTKSSIADEDLSRMSYLKATIKETFRLHPPLPLLIPRESMDQCIIQGHEIPKYTRVFINIWAIGRDPKLWEAPEEFRPERFLDNPINYKGHHFELIPFGAGRRICPGMQLGVSMLELAFANLVKNFDWELPDGIMKEDLDMGDSPGISSRRRQNLYLSAKPLQCHLNK